MGSTAVASTVSAVAVPATAWIEIIQSQIGLFDELSPSLRRRGLKLRFDLLSLPLYQVAVPATAWIEIWLFCQ